MRVMCFYEQTHKQEPCKERKPNEEASFDQCKELGALDYIHKPLELEELEKVVMSQLRVKK